MPKVYAIRRTIKANANLTVKFPENYFSKPPVISVGVESSSVSISVVMNSTTKDSVVINNSNNTDFYFNLIAVEYWTYGWQYYFHSDHEAGYPENFLVFIPIAASTIICVK